MSYTFSDIYIGVPDGATEAKSKMFDKLFCDYNNRYEDLTTSSEKFLVIGSKGSGKTYLANYICKQKKENIYRRLIDGKDFLIEKLGELSQKSVEKGYMYAFCSWYLYKKLAEYILDIHPIRSKIYLLSKAHKLKKFYESYNEENDIYSIVQKTVTKEVAAESKRSRGYSGTVEKDKLFNASGSLNQERKKGKRTEITYNMKKKEFYDLLNYFSKLVLNAVDKDDEICLILDDLDELDCFFNFDVESNITLNLIKAAKEINTQFGSNGKKVKIILLIRSDIMNKLQLCDMNLAKIKSSCGVELYWLTRTQTSPEEHPLMHMVLHKIKASCSELHGYTERDLYSMLFPEKIDGKAPLDYLLDYSFGRPRDIITYLNHVIEQYPKATAFTASELKEVRKLYSADLYDEVLNQTFYHKKSEYTLDCMKLISTIKKPSFTVEQVKDVYEENKDMFVNIDSVDNALAYLYTMSVIGNTWDQGKKSSWAYRKDSMDEIDLTKKMTIHYGLRKKFAT